MLTIAVILGIIEGLTEFLPVSSTGHLIIAGHLLGFTDETADTFEVFIQLGAILAVVVLYWRRFVALLPYESSGGVENRRESAITGWNGIVKLAAACAPVFVLGLLARDAIKAYLFSPTPVAWALIVGGIVMIFVDRDHRAARGERVGLDDISLKQAVGIGCLQCFALWPGISRSGATIIGGLACGLERRAAAEFSFLVAVPVMAVATVFDLLKSLSHLSSDVFVPFLVGFIVSFIVAIAAIRAFVAFLGSFSMLPFGVYRVVLGVVLLALGVG